MSLPPRLGVVLFEGFELLDVFGPLEAYGNTRLEHGFEILMLAEKAGPIKSAQGPSALADCALADAPKLDLILVPGGIGTRREVSNRVLLDWLAARVRETRLNSSVCTGAALFARAGVLDGRRATTNKFAFKWVAEQGPRVNWVREARWIEDGAFFTSAGVSAGIDMSLAIIARLCGAEIAEELAAGMEYEWHRDPAWDPFAKRRGLV